MRSAYVMQVSDRLVTCGDNPFDRDSNKTVVFHATDAIVSLSYTGDAYTESLPTDQWIAQNLWGKEFPDAGGGRAPGVIFNMSGHRPRDLGYSLNRLGTSIAGHLAGLPASKRKPPEIALAGWQWKRRGLHGIARPIVATMEFKLNPTAGEIGYRILVLRRNWHLESPRPFRFRVSPKGWMTLREIDELTADIASNSEVLRVRDTLIERIRRVSSRATRVGPDCTSVIIPPPGSRQIHLFYMPSDSGGVPAFGGDGLETPVPATYTPWLVGPNVVMAPAVVLGISPQPLGMFDVIIRGSELAADLTISTAFSSQRRPASPT